MSIQVTREIEEMVKTIFNEGQYDSEAAVLREALELLKNRDWLRREIQVGIAELERGESIDGEEVFRELEERLAELEGTKD